MRHCCLFVYIGVLECFLMFMKCACRCNDREQNAQSAIESVGIIW